MDRTEEAEPHLCLRDSAPPCHTARGRVGKRDHDQGGRGRRGGVN